MKEMGFVCPKCYIINPQVEEHIQIYKTKVIYPDFTEDEGDELDKDITQIDFLDCGCEVNGEDYIPDDLVLCLDEGRLNIDEIADALGEDANELLADIVEANIDFFSQIKDEITDIQQRMIIEKYVGSD